jgi:hypothetical protein
LLFHAGAISSKQSEILVFSKMKKAAPHDTARRFLKITPHTLLKRAAYRVASFQNFAVPQPDGFVEMLRSAKSKIERTCYHAQTTGFNWTFDMNLFKKEEQRIPVEVMS